MKQLIFMVVVTLIGVIGSLRGRPFYGVAVYYLYAILRPQYMWEWSLPEGVAWSFYVGVAAIAGTLLGVRSVRTAPNRIDMRNSSSPQWTNAHLLMLLFGAWICVSYLAGIHSEMGNLFMVDYAKTFTMFVVAALVMRSVRQVWVVVVLAAASLGYIAYEINYLYFVNHYLGICRNGYGGHDNNGAGLLLALGVPLCYFVWEGLEKWWRWIFLGLIPVIIHAVLMTYSRGAMVALLACVPLFLLRSRKRLQLTAIAIAVGFAIPFLAGNEIRQRFFSIEQSDVDESAQSRYASWSAAWAIAKDYPVFGAGVRGANQLTHKYGADMEGRTIHNQYLQIAADNGFIGAGLYIGALAATWWGLRRVRGATKRCDDAQAREAYAAACGIEGALVVFCTGAVFLSLEAFEAQYILILLGAQLHAVLPTITHKDDRVCGSLETQMSVTEHNMPNRIAHCYTASFADQCKDT
jgi:probable O-glycosylation ligase (exosortase A-associated)